MRIMASMVSITMPIHMAAPRRASSTANACDRDPTGRWTNRCPSVSEPMTGHYECRVASNAFQVATASALRRCLAAQWRS
jgi:hypothetical protein